MQMQREKHPGTKYLTNLVSVSFDDTSSVLVIWPILSPACVLMLVRAMKRLGNLLDTFEFLSLMVSM